MDGSLEHAAATQLADWSTMNAQLFTFHAGGASSRSSNLGSSSDSSEPVDSSSSRIPCMSWNKGRCTAPYTICRYYHRYSTCGGAHRSVYAVPDQTASRRVLPGADLGLRPLVPHLAKNPDISNRGFKDNLPSSEL